MATKRAIDPLAFANARLSQRAHQELRSRGVVRCDVASAIGGCNLQNTGERSRKRLAESQPSKLNTRVRFPSPAPSLHTPPNRLTTQRRLLQRVGAMRMGAAMMRYGSDLYLSAVMSGLVVTMLLFGAILVRSVGPAENGGRVITVSERSEPRTQSTPENRGQAILDVGGADLRGSLP
jgi:hypothetical protein